ncbi:MAG TPA: C45 family peptidase [archaeon]|nr:C45 family peptidase [archaeon]
MNKKLRWYSLVAIYAIFLIAASGCERHKKELDQEAVESTGIPYVILEGSPYEQGLAHGRQLKDKIQRVVWLWKENQARLYGVNPDSFIKVFLERTDYTSAIKEYTPELLEEVKGIATGADMDFNTIFAFQLLDEVGMNGRDVMQDKCSALGVNRTQRNPAIVAQNMDLEGFRNGYQAVLKIKSPDSDLGILVFTCAGLIATNGMNNRGLGVCVNALTQLAYKTEGLPVAYVIRGLLEQPDLEKAIEFVSRVKHATGQNYLIGGPERTCSFECSSGRVVEYRPEDTPGMVFHTNHPFVNNEFCPKHLEFLAQHPDNLSGDENSEVRFCTLGKMLTESTGEVDVNLVKQILSSGHPQHPICRPYLDVLSSHTFGSTVMVLSGNPELYVSAGPPDVNPYEVFRFGQIRVGAHGE